MVRDELCQKYGFLYYVLKLCQYYYNLNIDSLAKKETRTSL